MGFFDGLKNSVKMLGEGKLAQGVGSLWEQMPGNFLTTQVSKAVMPDDESRQELTGGSGLAALTASSGAVSSVGDALGFSGEGGGIMKGMQNVSSLKNMFGGNNSSSQVVPQATNTPINSNVGGFELGDYQQQVQGFANGGVPNSGKPALIVDEETGQPTGRMNEQGAEVIVPAEQVPQTTRNMQVSPNMGAFGSPTPSQSIIAEANADNEDVNELKQYKKSLFPTDDDKANATTGAHDKESTIRIDKKETGIAPKDKTQMSDVIRGLARMTGYYYDMRKNRYGLGKSALTMWLDNVEGKEAQTAKNKASSSNTKQSGIDKTAEINLRHENKMAEIAAGNKGTSAKDLEKDKIRVREEASEDWDNLSQEEKEKYKDTPEGKKNYINDRLNIAIESKVPEYKKETIKEKKPWYKGGGTKDTEIDKRTGKYIPSDNAQADESNTIAEGSKSVDKKTGKKIIYKNGKWVENK